MYQGASMKIVLSNATSGKMCTVYTRGEPESYYHQQAYRISRHVFRRIVKTLCPKPTDGVHGITHKDTKFRLVEDRYNYRGYNDGKQYYIVLLDSDFQHVKGHYINPEQCIEI